VPNPPAPGGNPYRQILRRYVPEPLLALLIFIMGIWLWDNHFGPAAGYDLETCRMTLLKTDRNLRLANGAAGLPAPICRALAIQPLDDALQSAEKDLTLLGKQKALDDEGVYALTVVHFLRKAGNPAAAPLPGLELPPPNPEDIARRVGTKDGKWWDTPYLEGVQALGGPALLTGDLYAATADQNHRLVKRAAIARGGILVLALMGVGFIPRTLRACQTALRSRSRGYPGAWKPGLGIGIFLLSYLASIGFSLGIERLIHGPGDGSTPVILTMPMLLGLDTAGRLLPALVALGLLFRRGDHAISRLGLRKMPDVGLVLGMFALLTAIDRLLRPTLGGLMVPDPTGGLTSTEAGAPGLAFMAISACLAAPVTEEILYRGVLFQTLSNRFRVPAATILSALVFAVVHFYDAYGVASVGLFGVASALCFRSRGALSTSILLHVFYNSMIKFPEWIVYHAAL
jgi:membrane protease YdiL (CAAX protease family)